MPKKLIRRWMPDHHRIREHKNLQFLGERLHDPNLWHLNRRSVAGAVAIGLLVAWIPIPGQMAVAGLLALYFRANLPISVVLVWITNPITMPPMFYSAYRLGLWALNMPGRPKGESIFTADRFFEHLGDIWQPFLFGCLIMGTLSSVAGYAAIRLLWRQMLVKYWNRRKKRQPAGFKE